MIKKIVSATRTTEIDTSTQKIQGSYLKSDLNSDTYLVKIFTDLGIISEQLARAIKRSKVDSELDEKDEIRDDKLRAAYYLVFGLVFHPDAEVKAAAQVVINEFNKYGLKAIKESYAIQTSHVSSLLEDLAKTKVQAAISQLTGVEILVTELDAAETDFEQTSLVYDEEKAEADTLESATILKKQAISIINDRLVDYLRVMLQLNETVYGNFARTVAQIIDENNTAVKRRRKKKPDTDK